MADPLCLQSHEEPLSPLPEAEDPQVQLDWGNGVLFDEEKRWQDYLQMVKEGLIAPEIALGWRFNLPAETPQQRALIREKFMPENKVM